jgi:triacylglycerol lipase
MSSPLGSFLRPEGYTGPQGVRALAREASAITEAAQLVRRVRADRRSRSGVPYVVTGRPAGLDPVVLVPGFMAGDSTLRAMSVQLRRAGWRTYRSQTHVNVGCTREAADRLERRLEVIATKRGRKVSVVGHSLGGMLARGLAARRPDLVDGVVALGSPVLAPGAVHRLLAFDAHLLSRLHDVGLRGVMGADCFGGDCARESWEESQSPLDDEVSFTAVYSRRDGIVDWRACLDPAATHVEVRSSHCGMAVDPAVIDVVVTALREQQLTRGASPGATPPTARPA